MAGVGAGDLVLLLGGRGHEGTRARVLSDVTDDCIDPATWDRFDRGELPVAGEAVVRAHLAGCARCSTRYLEADETAVGLAAAVRAADELAGPTPGDRVGRYVIVERIAAGGMGSVYAAFDPKLGRKVALKLLSSRLRRADERGWQLRFEREAQALARLLHPNVVVVHDAGVADGVAFIAMELVEGQTLKAWFRSRKRSWREVVAVFCAAGRGLAAAHAAGMVHRDFKPDNVMVGDDGRVRVTDFGIAHVVGDAPLVAVTPPPENQEAASATRARTAVEGPRRPTGSVSSTPLTRAGMVMGTPGYMAPEQLRALDVDARTDQFSFCSALYEVLYGQRAFAGDDAEAIEEAVLDGRVTRPPRDARVPARLQRILLRGLSVDPSARFPSMDALLVELERDPAAQRRRVLVVVAMLAVLGALGFGYRQLKRQQVMMCQGAERKLVGLWDDARRRELHGAFVATGAPYAQSVFDAFARAVDAYTQSWVAMRTESCEATRLRGEQSEELLDLRMQCLDRRRDELKAQLDVFAAPDAQSLLRAVPAMQALPGVAECADTAQLKRSVRLPADVAARGRIDAVRRQIAHGRALGEAGRFVDGLRVVRPAVEAARTLAFRPVEAEALLALADLEEGQGDYRQAAGHFVDAALAGEAARDDQIAARGWIRLVWTLGEREGRYDDAHDRARYADAVIERVESAELRDMLTAERMRTVGVLEFRQGRYDAAFSDGQRALALFSARQGPESLGATQCLADLGDARMEEGRYEEALELYARALAVREKVLGPAHPQVAIVLNNQGIVYKNLGRYEQAIATYQRALEIREKTIGPDHPHVGAALSNLAEVLARQGKYAEALAQDRRALAIFERVVGDDHPDVAEVLDGIGDVLRLQGNLAEALRQYQRALAIDSKALGPRHPALAAPLVGIGKVQLLRAQWSAAAGTLERALQIRQASPGDPIELADARFALARALGGVGDEARALNLAAAARDAFAAAGAPAREQRREADEWLAKRKTRPR